MSGFIVKELIHEIVNVSPLSYVKMCDKRYNFSYHGLFDSMGIEQEGYNDQLVVDGLWLC